MKKPPSEPLLGAHVSIAGGLPASIERANRIEATAAQIFVKNNNQWVGRKFHRDEILEFRRARARSNLSCIVAHAAYLINLASPDPELWEKSIGAMVDELERCCSLGLSHLVVHPGAHRGRGEPWGIQRIAAALDRIEEEAGGLGVGIALETTAGQGSQIGYRLEHLGDILGACRDPAGVSICLDTCHLFAAGYDFRTRKGYLELTRLLEATVGGNRVAAIHVNDSKRDCGTRADRHEHLGKGFVGRRGFAFFLNDPRFASVPKLLETPKGPDLQEDITNLSFMRSLIR